MANTSKNFFTYLYYFMDTNFALYLNKKKRSFDEQYMKIALEQAEIGKSLGEAARGAVLVFPNSYMADHQTIFTDHNPLAYAEMNVLKKACQMTNKSFKEAILYATIEPNSLCAIAAYEYGIREIVFGVFDDVNGFASSNRSIVTENFNLSYMGGILSEACYTIVSPSLRENLRIINETHTS